MSQKYLILLCFLLYSFFANADDNDRYQDIRIKFSQTNLTVKQALDELSALPEVNIVYKGSETFLNYKLKLPLGTISVKEALQLIEKQAPVDIVFNNNYVIVKSRKLKESYELKGRIKDAETSEILIGATIFVPGTNKGTATDLNGEFSLRLAPGNYELEVRYLGYKNKQFNNNLFEDKTLTLFLEATQQEIKEVKVIGNYIDIQNLETGRNIECIGAKTIEQINYNNPTDALQGRVNGVWVTRISGAPGDHQKIRIRGINSLFAAVDPLYVVNGVQIPVVNLNSLGIADINSRDIESITVLKDVSSTAYYGFQGGNGVVKIETKKGGGENKIHFSSKFGMQKMYNRYPLMNTTDFINTMVAIDTVYPNRDRYPRYFTYTYEGYYIEKDSIGQEIYVRGLIPTNRFVYPLPNDTLQSHNWQDELFTTGVINEYQLAFQGSKKKINYYISGNYYDHKGVVINSNFKKYSYSANLSKSLFKDFFIDFSGFGSLQKNNNNLDNYLGNTVILKGINIEPNYNSLTDFEKLNYRSYPVDDFAPHIYNMYRFREMYAYRSADILNLYINKLPDGRDFFSMRNQGLDVLSNNYSLGLSYHYNTNLSVSNRSSISLKDYTYESLIRVDSVDNHSKFTHSNEKYRVISNVFNIDFSKQLMNHVVSLNACYRFYRDQVKWIVDSVYGYSLDEIDKSTDGYIRGSNAIYGKSSDVVRDINSVIFHAKYSYKNRYTISVFTNFDRLVEGNYVNSKAVFPSVALNWDMSKEFWLSSIKALNELSLYANWGLVGNYPLNSISNDINAETRISNGQAYEEGKYISNLANHNLKHEEIEEKNLGLKVNAFQNRLSLNTNYYMKENRNLIINREIPLYLGGGKAMINLGAMQHNGFELSIDVIPIETNTFSWNSVLGYSYDNQHVTEIYENNDTLLFKSSQVLIPDFYIAKDAQIGDIVGYRYEGVWTDKDEELQDPNYVNYLGIKYDKNDTTNFNLTENDKMVIGNSIPDFTCHWINNFRYKNLNISMHWYAVLGVDKYNATRASTYFTQLNTEISSFVQDSMSHFMDQVFYESSYFVEDASFVRLKSLNFVYTPKQPLWRNVKTSFSLSFENLITLTRYKGYDPEATIYTDNNFSNNAIDLGAYPTPISIFIGIDLTF